jgi:hypothetical protein
MGPTALLPMDWRLILKSWKAKRPTRADLATLPLIWTLPPNHGLETMISMTHILFVTSFDWVCMLGGAGNTPNSIWNHTLFILTTKHCIGIFKLKNFCVKECTNIIKVEHMMVSG